MVVSKHCSWWPVEAIKRLEKELEEHLGNKMLIEPLENSNGFFEMKFSTFCGYSGLYTLFPEDVKLLDLGKTLRSL